MITLEDIQGHWVRQWIKAPGLEDHTTQVHWMQVGTCYADLRVPVGRPDLTDAGRLCDLSANALRQLASAEGFAGHARLTGAECTWHREINWHGTPEVPDVGTISFDDEGRMIEAGVHAEYTELWVPHQAETSRALRLSGHGYFGYLVTQGDTFVLGIGRPGKPTTLPLVEALNSGQIPTGIETLFDGLHALGRVSDGTAIARLSTDPIAEGTEIARLAEDALTWHRRGFGGECDDVVLECAPA